MRLWLGDVNDDMHRKRARRIWGDLRKVRELSSASKKDGWLSLARRGLVSGARVLGWGGVGSDGNVSIGRLCLSLYVEKPLNSKVIKGFVTELRSRKCFLCFGISMLYIYIYIYIYELWTFYAHFTYPYHSMVHGETSFFQVSPTGQEMFEFLFCRDSVNFFFKWYHPS